MDGSFAVDGLILALPYDKIKLSFIIVE